MTYPAVLLSLTLLMVIFMMIFIVPRITESFEKAGSDLPALTQVVVDTSQFFVHDWPTIIAVFLTIFAIIKMIGSSNNGKMMFARMFMHLPVFGYVVRQSNIIYFIQSFTILLDS